MQPLASSGNTRTNLSTSISLTLIDSNGDEIPIRANADQPIELTIPRDVNIIIPSFQFENVSSMMIHNQSFNVHFVNISRENNLSISIHLEMHPLNRSNAYCLIYRFDGQLQINLTDGWTFFCPSGETFID